MLQRTSFNSSQEPYEADKGEMDKIIAKISVAKLIAEEITWLMISVA
jgi:hypothetical protein